MKITLSLIIFTQLTCTLLSASEEQTLYPPKAWKTHCILCHGKDGLPTKTGAAVGARDLTDGAYLRTRTDEDLARSILEGVKRKDGSYSMIPYKSIISENDIKELIDYVRKLEK